MRQWIVRALVLAALGAGFLTAQRRGPARQDDETWPQRRVRYFAARLNLTEPQKEHALALFTSAEQTSEPLEERLMEGRRALRDAARRNAPPAEIDQLATTVGSLTGQLAAIEAKTDAAFYSVLTQEQKQNLEQRHGQPHAPRER